MPDTVQLTASTVLCNLRLLRRRERRALTCRPAAVGNPRGSARRMTSPVASLTQSRPGLAADLVSGAALLSTLGGVLWWTGADLAHTLYMMLYLSATAAIGRCC